MIKICADAVGRFNSVSAVSEKIISYSLFLCAGYGLAVFNPNKLRQYSGDRLELNPYHTPSSFGVYMLIIINNKQLPHV